MSDTDKVRIKPLDDKDDYRLWRIRMATACDSKGLENVLAFERCPEDDDESKKKFKSDQKKASNIIVAALSDRALRVVRSNIGSPYLMINKLDERYDSKSAAARIAKMTELISMRYDSMKKGMGTYIDQMAGILEQLESMQTPIPTELSTALLISSIHVPELAPVAAAVKTLSDDDVTWEKVTARLMEEHQTLKGRNKIQERALPAHKHCELCKKNGHSIEHCWLNPNNPKNRLGITTKSDGKPGNSIQRQKSTSAREDHPKKIKKSRAAIARAMLSTLKHSSVMMLDSGTTTHMTNAIETIHDVSKCNVPISLGDDSEIQATHRGTRTVTWASKNGETDVHLSETLASRELSMSLLSIPALT